jgi:hypothetical protein
MTSAATPREIRSTAVTTSPLRLPIFGYATDEGVQHDQTTPG